jgi:hypothetical protein
MNSQIVESLQQSTCAIGYTTIPLENYVVDPYQPHFKVIGSGFLVTNDAVMTNRHVIQGLIEAQAGSGFSDDQRVLLFTQPTTPGRWSIHVVGILALGFVTHEEVDVGLVTMLRPEIPSFASIQPLVGQSQSDFSVTESVAICGFPFGHAMLQKNGRVHRWGPVLQQGYVSAISPFTNTNKPNELLLDIRIAPGMSGSAVVRVSDGLVIGIVHSAWENATAVAFPLDSSKLQALVRDYENQKPKEG